MTRALTFTILTLVITSGSIGCASKPGELNITSLDHRQTYRQQFARAYASRTDGGDFQVVLVNDAARPGDARSGDALRQVMHVRVLWQPMRGTKWNHPSATNATITWYVFGDPDGAGADVLEYSGAGFVALSRSGDTARLEVRNATIKPSGNGSRLNDPLGTARLEGIITARTGRSDRVERVLAQVREATSDQPLNRSRQASAAPGEN